MPADTAKTLIYHVKFVIIHLPDKRTKGKIMNLDNMLDALYKKFNLNAVPSEDFDGHKGGIWIRDDICKEETDFYPYAEGTMDADNKLNQFLAENGWFAEPHDSETIMIWKA